VNTLTVTYPASGFHTDVEGSGASRPCEEGGTGMPESPQPEASATLAPALERPWVTLDAGMSSSEPGEPKATPILDTPTGTIRPKLGVPHVGPPKGQRVLALRGVPAQYGFDGLPYDLPVRTPVGDLALGELVGSSTDPRQAPLPLPEPWRDGGGQLRLDVGYVPPTLVVYMLLREYQDALAACWRSLALWLKVNGWDERDVAFCERRAREVPLCGDWYMTARCECGYEDDRHAQHIDGCDSRMCPRCAKRLSRQLRWAGFAFVKSHPVLRVKGKVSRGYFLHTTTEKKPEVLTVEGLRESVRRVKRASAAKWKKVARFNPRKKDGRYGKYPGRALDAGMVSRIELGPHGNIHAHELRYGAFHRSEDLRQAAGGCWTRDTQVRQDEHGARGGVVEALKYVTKASVKPGRREFTHPALAVLFEFATRSKRLVEGYGTMRGMVTKAENAALEENQGVVQDAQERLHNLGACPCCGRMDAWSWERVKRGRDWFPPPRARAGPSRKATTS